MARLEDLTIGARVTGIVGNAPVTVVAVNWFGDMGLEVTVKDDRGQLSSQILYREDEARLAVSSAHLPWSFDADADDLRLASEAYRIHIAHLFDTYLAVHTSAIDPLPRTQQSVRRRWMLRHRAETIRPPRMAAMGRAISRTASPILRMGVWRMAHHRMDVQLLRHPLLHLRKNGASSSLPHSIRPE